MRKLLWMTLLLLPCVQQSLAQQPTGDLSLEQMQEKVKQYLASPEGEKLTVEQKQALLSPEGQRALESLLEARVALQAGVTAYKAAQYDEAIKDFKESLALDPGDKTTELYLGTAYAQKVIPEDASAENIARARLAIDCFQSVLQQDATNTVALKQIASIHYNIKKMGTAKEWQRKVIAANPADFEAFYTIGVIDWQQAYANEMSLLATESLKDDGVGNIKKSAQLCRQFKQDSEFVEDGIQNLQKAIALKPDYSDAMTYLNLTYRRKADVDCGNSAAVAADVSQANEWSKKSVDAKKAVAPQDSFKN